MVRITLATDKDRLEIDQFVGLQVRMPIGSYTPFHFPTSNGLLLHCKFRVLNIHKPLSVRHGRSYRLCLTQAQSLDPFLIPLIFVQTDNQMELMFTHMF